jgi:hypothetical protein
MSSDKSNSGDRARKRSIRKRMEETGETYVVAARAHDVEQARTIAIAAIVVRCPNCITGSISIIDEQIGCAICSARWESPEAAAEAYAEEFLGLNWYSTIKDGGAPPRPHVP